MVDATIRRGKNRDVVRTTLGRRACLLASFALGLPACSDGGGSEGGGDESGDEGADDGAQTPPPVVFLTPEDHLVRISMALRGLRPSPDEIVAVAEDPEALPELVDGYMQGENFGAVVRDLHNDGLLSRVDFFVPPAGFLPTGPLAGTDVFDLNWSIMDAPLRLAEYIVTDDRPYTELVTADYTVADETVAQVWGLDYEGAGSWAITHQVDERGNAGILTDSWVFTRHDSTAANANRGRANALTRALLCEDFLDRPADIETTVDLSDPQAVQDAVMTDPTCVSCHQSLDPLASFFSGYITQIAPFAVEYPVDIYSENFFSLLYGVELRDPAYFGVAGENLQDLGQAIASDPRFSLCTAKRFYAYFNQVELHEVPHDRAQALQSVFVDSNFSAKTLIKTIMLSDDFRASHIDPEAELDPEDASWDHIGLKKTRPTQLALFIDDMTSLRWKADLSEFGLGRVDVMDDTFVGFQMLGGGIDGYFVTRPTNTYNATSSLLLRALAREGAGIVVAADFTKPKAERLLFDVVDEGTSDEAAIREQLVSLSRRIYAKNYAADDPEIDALLALHSAAQNTTNTAFLQPSAQQQAWMVVISAMLQDPRVAFH